MMNSLPFALLYSSSADISIFVTGHVTGSAGTVVQMPLLPQQDKSRSERLNVPVPTESAPSGPFNRLKGKEKKKWRLSGVKVQTVH